MARGRMISTTIAEDVEFNGMGVEAQLMYLRTIPHLDRDGLINGHPFILFGKVAPLMPDLAMQAQAIIDEWVASGLVIRYASGKTIILFFKGFIKNQQGMRYDREGASTFPVPPGYQRTTSGLIRTDKPNDNQTPPKLDEPPQPPTPGINGATPHEENQEHKETRTNSGVTPDQLRTRNGVTPPEVNIKEVKGREGNACARDDEPKPVETPAAAVLTEPDTTYADFVKEYQAKWAMLPAQYHAEKIQGWCDRVPIQAWVYALKECADSRKVGNWKYFERILERVEQEGVPETAGEKVVPQKASGQVEFSLGGLFQ